jgi:hypothetical protein
MSIYEMPGIIAVDFDGTVVDHRYPEVGSSAPLAAETLRDLNILGYKLILNTMRSGRHLKEAMAWFEQNGIKLYGVGFDPEQKKWTTSNKCYAQLYIDDMAFGVPLTRPNGFRNDVVDWIHVRIKFNLTNRLARLTT